MNTKIEGNGEVLMSKKDIRITFYNLTDEQKKRVLYYRKRKAMNDELLKKMVNIVESKVKKYKSDFYIHDMELIQEIQGEPFIWVVREKGTHFIHLYYDGFDDQGNWEQIPYFKCILKQFHDIMAIFLVENGKIGKIPIQEALKILDIYGAEIKKSIFKKHA